MPDSRAIQVTDLSKRYRIPAEHKADGGSLWNRLKASAFPSAANDSEFWALRNISFKVSHGEITGIIGRNGAGKSTLLKILSRITRPTSGHVQIFGRMASLLEVGTGFHPELSGRENIFLNGAILGMTKSEITSKFDEIVSFSGTGRFLDMPVKYYSSGMSVRLAFSVAAHLNPEILVIDEVLAVGDTAFQKKCIGKMEGISRSGRTILLVSHNLSTIRQLCQRALVIEHGQIVFDGSTSAALTHYHDMLRTHRLDAETNLQERLVSHSGAVRFCSLSVKDDNNQERYEFRTGDTLRIHFNYKVFEDSPNLVVQVAFRSLGSNEIVTNVEHVLSSGPITNGAERSAVIEYSNVLLSSGEYTLYLWMGNRAGVAFDRIDYYQTFCPIINILSDENTQVMNPGYFRMASRLLASDISHHG